MPPALALVMPLVMRRSTRRPKGVVLTALALLAGLAIALLPASAVAQRRVEVYKAKHRTAEELVPLAQAAMAEDGGVEVDARTNSLVLIGDRAAVSEALALVSSQDRALRTVLLRYDTRRLRELVGQGFQLRWTAVAGAFRLGTLHVAPGPDASIQAKATDALERLAESFGGVMRAGEGESTRIETGTMVPYTTRGPSGSSTEFVNATRGFEAKPRILGDGRVEVDLAAFGRELRPDLGIDVTGASTLVIVEPGELIAVGSTSRVGTESHTDTLAGTRSRRRGDETVLLLRVDVE